MVRGVAPERRALSRPRVAAESSARPHPVGDGRLERFTVGVVSLHSLLMSAGDETECLMVYHVRSRRALIIHLMSVLDR